MSSATKALVLLSHFSQDRPEVGLSQLCRLAGRDKATTYRHLQALETAGFVEQNPATRQYRLGPALLHLAQIRETTVPRKEGAMAALATLAEATGETAHASVLSGTTMFSLASCESPTHGIRAVIDITTYPLHATASGLCALAFGPEGLMDVALADLSPFTPHTPVRAADLRARVEAVRRLGISHAERSFEAEIYGIAAPVFDHSGLFAGAVSVASVAARLTPALQRTATASVIAAARQITHNWGGTIPEGTAALWARIPAPTDIMEPTP